MRFFNSLPKDRRLWFCPLELVHNLSYGFIMGRKHHKSKKIIQKLRQQGNAVTYVSGKSSFGMIGRLLGVSHVSVYEWIRQGALSFPETQPSSSESEIIQPDEMWHVVNGKKTHAGSNEPLIHFGGEP